MAYYYYGPRKVATGEPSADLATDAATEPATSEGAKTAPIDPATPVPVFNEATGEWE